MICLTLLDYLSVGIGEDIAAVFGTNDVAGFRGCEGEVLRGVVVKGSCWSVHLDSNKLYLIKINDGNMILSVFLGCVKIMEPKHKLVQVVC